MDFTCNVNHPKKESSKKLREEELGGVRVWRGRGERRGGSGEKRMSGRPRATDRTAPTDRSDGRGRPIGRPGPSDHTAIDGTGRRIRRPRAAAADGPSLNGPMCPRPSPSPKPPSAASIKGVGPTILPHLSGRAGRFGIFCLIACAPSSALIHFYWRSFIGFSLTRLIVCSNWGRCLG